MCKSGFPAGDGRCHPDWSGTNDRYIKLFHGLKVPNFIAMPNVKFTLLIICTILLTSCSKKIIPEKPSLNNTIQHLDTLPLSEIDIPVRINLAPVYGIAEKEVDQVYTSPGYPNDYVVENCDTRYMYRFRRGPLQIKSHGSQVSMGFTGYYQMAGGQRVCSGSGSNRAAISPWSPTCTCGLREGERRVSVAFTASFALAGNYGVKTTINRLEPVPLDKCTVCFWGQDMTSTVMQRLKAQLDEARQSMIDTLQMINLRPQFQQVWDLLNTVQPLYNYGYLQINPQKIRISNMMAVNDTMVFSMGISARPVITQQLPQVSHTVIPDISTSLPARGFNIYIDAYLDYDSLSKILNENLLHKRIDLEKMGKYVIIEKCTVYGANNEKLIFRVDFSGSETGVFYLTGKPVYDGVKKMLMMENLEYDIRTKDILVKSAEWLFSKRILKQLQAYSSFEVAPYEKMLLDKMNAQLRADIKPGISMSGEVRSMTINKIYPFSEKLVIRFSTTGSLDITVNNLSF